MTQILTRSLMHIATIFAFFLLFNVAIVAQTNNNQNNANKNHNAHSAHNDTIDYDHLVKADVIENGVCKTYYYDPFKNIMYNPYAGFYAEYYDCSENETGSTSPATNAPVMGPLPTDFAQKILVAQQNKKASDNTPNQTGQTNQSNQAPHPSGQTYSKSYYIFQDVPSAQQMAAIANNNQSSNNQSTSQSLQWKGSLPLPGHLPIKIVIRMQKLI